MKGTSIILMALACEGIFCFPVSLFGQTWSQTTAPATNWVSVASSADGSVLVAAASKTQFGSAFGVAGPIYTSTDSGNSWALINAPQRVWSSAAISANGSNWVLAAYYSPYVYSSTNFGNGWTSNNLRLFGNFPVPVASSADGKHFLIAADDDIYTSSNSGNNWVSNNITGFESFAAASSADGTKLAAAGPYLVTDNRLILVSTNSGNSWTSNNLAFGPSSLAFSADGSKLFASTSSTIYLSTDQGNTWTSNGVPASCRFIVVSADGTTLAAATSAGVYTSSDSGATWDINQPSPIASSLAMSADGDKLVAVVNGGGIWTLQTTPAPQVGLAANRNQITLSWVVPSTNFVLQQNADLTATNWSNVTNPPVLNLTNLQNQATLPAPPGNAFFRLQTQ